jgi:hypothetical protein
MSAGEGVEDRARARRKAEARYGFRWNLAFYIVVNAFLVGVWYFSGSGLFWPIFSLGGWGIGVVANYWAAYGSGGESWVDRETERILKEKREQT